VEKLRDGHATSLGAASGAVAGLVAITPACAFLVPWTAVLLGVLAGGLCALAVGLKYRFGFDDSLDVVGVHLVGGLVGCLYLGFFATQKSGYATADGLFYGGGGHQLGVQALSAFSVLFYSLIIAGILGFVIEKTIGFRISEDDEESGIDLLEHAETGYDLNPSGSGAFRPTQSAVSTKTDEGVPA
jgi:ammonium transporter, Amt family